MFLFVAGLKTIQEVCTGIAVFLHYFLMCSFAWMSVMAFDVTKTFVFHGKTLYHSFSFSEISNTQRCCHFAHRLLHREVISPQRLFVFSDSRPAKFTEFLIKTFCLFFVDTDLRSEQEKKQKDFPKI